MITQPLLSGTERASVNHVGGDEVRVLNKELPLCFTCPGREGFRNIGVQTWVCASCGQPRCVTERNTVSVVLFREGPLDGKAYDINTLLFDRSAVKLPITEYVWTPDKVTSPRTGVEARVWMWKGATAQGRETMAEQTAAAAEPEAEPGRADEEPTSSPGADVGQAVPELMERRLRMKASRKELSDQSGLTVPQLARIEQDSPRTTEDERTKFIEALDALEAAGGGTGRGGRGRSPKLSE